MAHRYRSCAEIMMGEYTGKIAVSKDTMLFILNEVLENDIKKSTTKENILKMVPEIYEKTEARELIKILPYETYLLLEGLIEYVKKSDDILGFDSKCRELRKVEELKHLYDMMILVLNQKGAETTWHVNGNVLEKLERLFSADNRKIAARYWRMERLTMGMLYSYGVVDFDFLRKQLSRYMGEIISEAELDEFYFKRLNLNYKVTEINVLMEDNKTVKHFVTYLGDEVDLEGLIHEQGSRGFEYKIFREEDIIGRKEFLWTVPARRLYNFLNQKTSANEEDFETILKLNELGIDVLGDVCEFAEFSGDKDMDEFRRLFMEWYNNYPQYVLCGYAPVEFERKMRGR